MVNDNDNYIPVECGLHSEFELAIMHHTKLKLSWQDDEGTEHTEIIEPLDLVTRKQQEFLVIKRTGPVTEEIRLDKISRFSAYQ